VAYSIPTYSITVNPKYYYASDGTIGYRAVWLKHSSANATQAPRNDGRQILAPWSVWPGRKSRVWWFALEHFVETSWNPAGQGSWGRGPINLHNSPQDEESIGWSWGGVPSAEAYDYINGQFQIAIESSSFPSQTMPLFPSYTKGVWHSHLCCLELGRVDITNYNGFPIQPGRVRVWSDGNDTPKDSGPTNTVFYLTNPANGHRVLQGVMTEWLGHYTKNSTSSLGLRATAPRLGITLGECMTDTPVLVNSAVSDILDPNGVGPDLGPSTYSVLSSRSSSDFLLPPSLGGSTVPDPVVPKIGEWTTAIQWNASSTVTPPDVPPTVVEANLGPWATATQWNAASVNTDPPGGGGTPDDEDDPTGLTLTTDAPGTLTLTPDPVNS
jgi:hypothetical protein